MKIVRLLLIAGLVVAPAGCDGILPTAGAAPAVQALASSDTTASTDSMTASDTTTAKSGHMIGSGN
ncbi:MAG TPA: hypothetical protein VGR37_21470 [Longimicrobiaceae bacterium]|nr:hypothetical protein [Longimicrobiaceae bacterium]